MLNSDGTGLSSFGTFTMYMIFLVIPALLIFFLVRRKIGGANKLVEQMAVQFKLGKQVNRYTAKYLGGHPRLPFNGDCIISFREHGYILVVESVISPSYSAGVYNSIVEADFETQVRLNHNHGGRNVNVLTVTFNDQGKRYKAVFEHLYAGQVASAFNRVRSAG